MSKKKKKKLVYVLDDGFEWKRGDFIFTHNYYPPCFDCNHFDRRAWHDKDLRRCKAFEEIPEEIWQGKHDHKREYPGDKGIRFEEYEWGPILLDIEDQE